MATEGGTVKNGEKPQLMLRLVPVRGRPLDREAIQHVLKALGRFHGLRCLDYRVVPPKGGSR